MTLTGVIRKYADKPGRERLLGLLETLRSPFTDRGFTRVFWNGAWVHIYSEGAFVDMNISKKSLISESEKQIEDVWLSLYSPKKGDTIIDVGAGVGMETLYFSKAVGSSGKVIAIEAHPQTFMCLEKLIKYNKLENVTALNCAICDQPDTQLHISSPDEHILSTTVNAQEGCLVKGTTLDRVVSELGLSRIDFIKMNIEGAETMAMKGMVSCLQNTQCMSISCHDFLADRGGSEDMRTKAFVRDFLKENGYSNHPRDDHQRDYVRTQLNVRKLQELL